MRRMTSSAAFGLYRRVFVRKWTLLVGVALDAGGITAGRQPRLFQLEAAVRVMTIAATHRAFQHLVMEWHVELRFHFTVTALAKLRVAGAQHPSRPEPGLLSIDGRHVIVRTRQVSTGRRAVWRVTVGASHIIAPVFAAPKVVALFFSGVTGQTSFGSFFRRQVGERLDL